MDGENFVGFLCSGCRTEIQASLDMVGQETECPACGAKLRIPSPGDEGVLRHGPDDPDTALAQAMKSRTIRIELPDEL